MSEPIPFRAARDRDRRSSEAVVRGDQATPAGREPSARDRILTIVNEQASDASYDDILRELAFERSVRRGLDDLASGHQLDTVAVLKAFRTWRR